MMNELFVASWLDAILIEYICLSNGERLANFLLSNWSRILVRKSIQHES